MHFQAACDPNFKPAKPHRISKNSAYTDHELLRAIQQGDQEAFSVLYYRYYLPLSQKALQRLWSTALVEEVVQNVFVALWNKANNFEHGESVRAWLYNSLKLEILHLLRTERRRLQHEEMFGALLSATDDSHPAQQAETKEIYEKVMQAIAGLPEQCRRAYVLSRFENMSYREIAEKMGLSVSTVEKHIMKALKTLRETLSDQELGLGIILLAVTTLHR